jgi:hypothetical protein
LKGAAGIWNQRLQIPAARFKVKILGIAWPQRRAVGVKIYFLEADFALLCDGGIASAKFRMYGGIA